jgi:NADH pyrophosphatase NudC (nudix superfamily)
MTSKYFEPAKWAGRKFIDNQTGETLVIPDTVQAKQFFWFGDSFIDVGDGMYSRAGGDFSELTEDAIVSESGDEEFHCPACGQPLPELDDRAACLCPHCGVRCCEGSV